MDYWQEAVECALDEAGISATPKQIEDIAGAMEISHENYGMAMGHDVASANLTAHRERELAEARAETERERNKVICKECGGRGRIIEHGPVHSYDSECWKCRGEGRHDP